MTSPPGDPGRIFVVEREGTVRVVKNGVVLPTPFIDVSDEIGGGGERGLLSIAFAPDYAVSGLVYAFATQPNGTLVVWQFHAAPGADVADAGHYPVLSIPHSATNHNGGQLQFGPDGYLYIGIGDNANSGNGQNITTPLGKILRIVPHPGSAYTIPPGQPFTPGALARDLRLRPAQSVALLVRLADRRSADRRRRRRQLGGDRPAPGRPGARRELRLDVLRGHPRPRRHCTAPGAIPPIYEYAHDAAHCSITGGFVARDPTVPTLAGRYLFADYCGPGAGALNLPVGSPPDIGVLGAARHIAGFGSGLRRPPLHHLAGRRRLARHRNGRGRQAARRQLHALDARRRRSARTLHLDASGSTDPDGPIISYLWDIDGDGKTDGKGVAFDVSYPTAGARPITLTVGDAAGARSSRTQAVFVGGKGAGGAGGAGTLTAKISVPGKQKLKTVRKRGLLVRFRSNTSATWRITATMRKVARVGADTAAHVARPARAQDVRRRTRATARCACGSRSHASRACERSSSACRLARRPTARRCRARCWCASAS